MSHLDYGFEKFSLAVDELSASTENIKKRLHNATYHLGVLREHHVPEEMKEKFNFLYKRITSGTPQNREGTLLATINQITDEEAVKIAGDIVSFNEELVLWRGKNWGKY